MARRRRRGSPTTSNRYNPDPLMDMDSDPITESSLDWRLPQVPRSTPYRRPVDLFEVEDGRTWSPDPAPSPRSPRRWRSHLKAAPAAGSRSHAEGSRGRRGYTLKSPAVLKFAAPQHIIRCIRRKQRRQIILAKGYGGGGKKRGKRNYWSNIHCR